MMLEEESIQHLLHEFGLSLQQVALKYKYASGSVQS